MSEIRVLIDPKAESELKDLISDLKEVRDLTEEIKSKKGKLVEAKGVEEVSNLTAEIEQLRSQIEKLTSEKVKAAKGSGDLEKAVSKLSKSHTKEAQELANVQEKLRQQNQVLRQNAKDSGLAEGSLAKMRIELSRLQKQYDNLSAAERNNKQVGGELLIQIQQLDKETKKLEESTGRHQRSVGDYAKGFRGLSRIMSIIEQKTGIQIHLIRESILATSKLLKGYKDVSSGLGDNTKATEKATVTQRIWNTVKAAGVLGLGLIVVALAAVGFAIFKYIESTKESSAAEKERQKAIDGTIIKDDELRQSYNKSVFELKKLSIEYQKLTGAISDFQAQIALAKVEYDEALNDIKETTKKELKEAESFWVRFFSRGLFRVSEEDRNKIAEKERILKEELTKKAEAEDKIRVEEEKQRLLKEAEDVNRELTKLRTAQIEDEHKRKIQELKDNARFASEDINISEKTAEQKAALIKEINSKLTFDIKQENKKLIEENRKLADQHLAEFEKIRTQIRAGKISREDDLVEKEKLQFDERLRNAGLFGKEREKLTVIELELLEQLELEHIENILKIQSDAQIKAGTEKLDAIKKANAKEKELNALEFDIRLKEAGNNENKITEIKREQFKKREEDLRISVLGQEITEKEYLLRLRELQLEQADFEKKLREKQVKEIIDSFDILNEAQNKAAQKRIAEMQKQTQDEISELDRRINFQNQLLLNGEKNISAELEKERADALLRKRQLEEKARRQEEAQQLVSYLFELAKILAKDGDKNAELKAFAKTVALKELGKALAGGLYEGTESVSKSDAAMIIPGAKKDNLLVRMHEGERVVGYEDSKKLDGISNAELIKAAELYRMNIFNKEQILADVPKKEQVDNAVMKLLSDKLDKLNSTIENAPNFVEIGRTIYGELYRIERENKITKKIITKEIGTSYSKD